MATPEALRAAAFAAMARSHSPHSRFAVGAAIEDDRGTVHAGANIECVATPLGACAEVTAIAHMVMSGGPERRIRQVAVIGGRHDEGPVAVCSPCGGCRQRLAEFVDASEMASVPVHLCTADGIAETMTLAELLPGTFTATLGESEGENA